MTLAPNRIPFRAALALASLALLSAGALAESPRDWAREFPRTDFDITAIGYDEISFDGARRDSIPPIDAPRFVAVGEARDMGDLEPVIGLGIAGDFRAYPLRILLWHEIVNDVVGGVPVLISYCPLCNSGVVFDRRLEARVLEFGNTGRLRHFDMVMYDRNTESWWQQFLGQAIMGAMTGARLEALPSRLESLERFRARAPEGKVLVPNDPNARPYGTTPYVRMDSRALPEGALPYALPAGVRPFARVVVVGDQAWTLELLRARGRIETGDLILTWEAGQNSIHDTRRIAAGRDVGNVLVRRRTETGLEDVPYDGSFAFAFPAFVPGGTLHHE